MPILLHIDSSPMVDTGVTRRLTAYFVERWRAHNPAGRVIRRDVGLEPPPHPDARTLQAIGKDDAERTDEDRRAAALSDRLLEELEAADVVVIGSPMYNFSVTSGLKAWFDLVSRPGRTFRYTANGVEGMLSGKTVVALTGRGGFYARDAAGLAQDHQAALIRTFFGFLGLDDVHFIHAEGQGIDPATAAAGEESARKGVDALFASGELSRVA
jgi:FMN-dependent NADH-azoreductase